MSQSKISAYLQKQQNNVEFSEWFVSFEELYNKRLWHQLTVKLLDFVQLPNANNFNLLELYENFLSDFETKINLLSLVEIVVFIIKTIKDFEKCLQFIQKIKEKVKSNQDAFILCQILIGQLKLANNDLKVNSFLGVKEILSEIEPVIDNQTGITPVHGRYFQLSSNYYQVIGNHCKYYRGTLRYLGCLDYEKESKEDLYAKAFALALAALLGESIFNFGELLQHPIINHLKQKDQWLIDLLEAFNSGDLQKFSDLRPTWSAQPDLASHEIQLRQKISLLSLMELTFKSPNGILTFDEIAAKTFISSNVVELLVMKALSLNLVKGEIDEVEKKVNLNWVQPRVLDKQQINILKLKLEDWSKNIRKVENMLESNAQEIIG
ncbi:hypothetical protein RND71_043294 [Anisodus tanguticus]|uniref:PCI domain-containing protein n=1 Tax=Anisodus tanguticus TaxID=243964 RepID=A0AAE1UTV3_9SOLA|nr:hypothetical protein RND71_043294 [Anisodus tanguticus]